MWVVRVLEFSVKSASLTASLLPSEKSPISFIVVKALCERLNLALAATNSKNLPNASLTVNVTMNSSAASEIVDLRARLIPTTVAVEFNRTSRDQNDGGPLCPCECLLRFTVGRKRPKSSQRKAHRHVPKRH